jgi:2-polyprenyl-3-methyl-5-hydroxy-6-metoxy-1,4-benzoquinol methylase
MSQSTTQTKTVWEQIRQAEVLPTFTLGPVNTESVLHDLKHLGFTLARYKFAAKMLQRCTHILEVGCGEGIGALMFLADTPARVTGIDFDQAQIAYATQHVLPHGRDRLAFLCQDLVAAPYAGPRADGLVSLDVIEHIDPAEEPRFLQHCADALEPRGAAVIGTPSLHAHQFSSPRSQKGHINLFDPVRLTSTLERHFSRVFLFSMNDEMVHTGFNKLAHYLMALCVK